MEYWSVGVVECWKTILDSSEPSDSITLLLQFHFLTNAPPEMKYVIVGTHGVSNSEMRDFFAELGRTRVFTEAYNWVRRRWEPAENDAQWKKSHFWMETK
jgi:hypothetical protein